MRLFVVGHSYVTAFAQSKYVAMKKLAPSLKLRLLVPHEVPHTLMTVRYERTPGLERDEVIPLTTVGHFRSNMSYVFWPMRLYSSIREFQPDIIHIEEEPHALITFESVVLARLAAPRAAISLFTWDNLYRTRRFPLSLAKKRLGEYCLRRSAVVICGNREAEGLLRTQRGYRGSTAVLPQVGIDPESHGPGREDLLRERLGLNGSVCVGYIGRLVREKGVILLMEALASLETRPWKLLLVGSGPLAEQIRAQWADRFGNRMIHLPPIPHWEVPRYLRCLDIFVLASYATAHWKEQFGLTLAQAMMVGVPAVAASSGAIPEVLGPGGLIFKEGDVNGLAKALAELLASVEKREELGRRARAFALRNYTTQTVAAQYLDVFKDAYEQASVSRENRSLME